MIFRIGRTLPPAAAPIPFLDVLKALPFCLQDDAYTLSIEQETGEVFGKPFCFFVVGTILSL